ncbi:uncharacterized protein LOC131884323 [Tigriopus californicus]|nr:uncharacterized protein LOC131884323 [Tigriopus californicus]
MGITDPDICCGYGLAGVDIRGYDCLLVPSARSAGQARLKANRFCGASRGLAAIGSQSVNMVPPLKMGLSIATTICSNRVPFAIRFVSDNFEFTMEIRPQKGFRLLYQLSGCT